MWSEKLSSEGVLKLRWIAHANPLRNLEQFERILQLLDSSGRLRPELSLGKFKGPFDVANLRAQLARKTAEPFVSLELRRQNPDLEYSITLNAEFDAFHLTAKFQGSELEVSSTRDQLLAVVRGLASIVGVRFARASDMADMDLADDARGEDPEVPNDVREIYWLTVFGGELVKQVGKDRLLTTPAFRVEELDADAVLIQLTATPDEIGTPQGRRAQARALAHLQSARPEEEIYADLMKRSQHLAPVEIAWDGDVGPLFQLFVNDERQADRPSMIARFNARKLPAVDEARDKPLAGNVDVEDALDDYDDRAEQLIALLHKQVPDMETFEPRVVAGIDYWCWRFNFAEDYERKHVDADLVPALGAYVALVMVKHLGGTLVPRKKLDESQVVIGGRAYLPFLRARHQLASREDAIDHSMTQFLAVAKRGG